MLKNMHISQACKMYTHRLVYDKIQYSGAKKVMEQYDDKIMGNILTGSGTARGSLSPLSIQPCSANKSFVQIFVFSECHKFVKKKGRINLILLTSYSL